MAAVEGVVLEEHDVRYEEGILQLRVVYIAELYAAQREETLLELDIKVRRHDAGRGEAADNGGGVKLAIEYAVVELGIVGGTEEMVEAATCEHEGKEGTWGRGQRVKVARE